MFVLLNNLSHFADIATILASASIIIAFIQYLRQKRSERLLLISELISFFRKEVLPEIEKLNDQVWAMRPGYIHKRISLLNPSIKYLQEQFKSSYDEQVRLTQDTGVIKVQTTIINALEELALKIRYSKSVNDPALNAIKAAFVQTVESNASVIVLYRDVHMGDSVYNNTLALYKKWEKEVDKTSVEERLAKLSS